MAPVRARTASWITSARRRGRRALRELALRPGRGSDAEARREELAIHYLRGDGIEIGALHRPLRVAGATRVRYVDVMSREDLLVEVEGTYDDPDAVVVTDVIDDGETLARFEEKSVDFVIANHVLEHVEDPVATLKNWVRVLRPGGVLLLTLPDARFTFDERRPRTTVEHLLRDHAEGPSVSRREHFEEWARIVEDLPSEHVAERVAQFEQERPRLHFHVWELDGFLELLRAIELPAQLEAAQAVEPEFSVVLRRLA